MSLPRTLAPLALALGVLLAPPLPAAGSPATPDAVTVDGGRYFGPLADGKLEGRGRIEWDNGARYEGEFRNGRMDGEGRLEEPDGTVYVGRFAQGLMDGKGRLETVEGEVYEGDFAKGRFEGQGRYTDGEVSYTGEFRNWRYEGRGTLVQADGRKHEGAFARGFYEGKGRHETPGKEVYEGDFVHGEFTGEGAYTGANGERHEGAFVAWQPHGPGRYTDPNGNLYEGRFEHGQLNGTGRLAGKDGGSYEGEFSQWRFHGRGVLKLPNGDVYEGQFANGLYQGEGTLTYARPQADGRTRDSGTWRYGRLVDEEAERLARLKLEAALYTERALLDRSLHGLLPEDPGKIDLYLLAVGGDASQEVFRREVEFVREQFDRDFGTAGRSLALVNSRSTLGSAPMATLTSLRESLQATAARMDRENDILFLFLTSHGSKEHALVLDQQHMSLPDLPAAELGRLLDESGIRWRVVVVSACYSGGFVDALKNDRTLVITAARHDRRSFGCSDDNDFTYFGRAFFKNALPRSKSFKEAFDKAETQIKAWELADLQKADRPDPEHFSMPQIHSGSAVEQQLRRWWSQRETGRRRVASASADHCPRSLLTRRST